MSSIVETRFMRVAGRQMHVRVVGEGPVVLLLHGIPTNGTLWNEVAPRLANRARVIIPDLLGFGASEPPADLPAGLPAHTRYVLELLDELGIVRATVVGHDIGGGIAQLLATRHADRVERLGLVNCVCYDNWPVAEMRALQVASPVAKHFPAGLSAEGMEFGLRRGFVHQDRAGPYLDGFLEPFSDDEGWDLLLQHVRALDSRPTEEIALDLPKLQIPAAVVWGRQDPFLDPKWAERLAADIPGAELTWIEDASHFSPADAPAQVAGAIERLLDRAPVAATR